MIDTCYTLDCGWETIVRECCEDEDKNVIPWEEEVDMDRYSSKEAANEGHIKMADKWKMFNERIEHTY